MPLYITVSEGSRADRARPVLALSDTRIIAELLRAIERMGSVTAQDDEPSAGDRGRGVEGDARETRTDVD